MKNKMNKNFAKWLISIIVLMMTIGCSKGDPDRQKDEDTFNPKFVNSNWGHYSGVLVGSTGYFNILVTGVGVSAVVFFDGQR